MPMHRDHAVHAPSGMLVPPVPPARRRHVAALAVALGAVVAGGAAHAAQSCPQLPPGAGVPPLSLTPLVVRPLQTVIEPVPATDGLVHLAYAAQATNMHQGRAEILSIVPVDPLDKFRPTGRNRVLDTDGAPITGKVRLFAPPLPDPLDEPPQQDFSRMPGGSSGITFFDVTYQNAADVPRLIAHRITVRLANVDDTVTELTDPVPVDCRPPVVLSPPLTGHRWWDANGCCEVIAPHRGATLPINGDIKPPEQFAIDWVQLTDRGTCCTGPVKELSSWPFFGAPIFASAPGKIVELVDTEPEQVPGPPVGVTVANAAGNHVIQDIGGGRFVLYAHLRKGSIPAGLHVGDTLAAGRQIGEVGNSGSSTAPHLHFQVMDRPSTLDAVGLPFVFDRQRVEGRVLGVPAVVDEAYEAGRPVRTDTAGAGGRADRMPAEGQIFAFRGP